MMKAEILECREIAKLRAGLWLSANRRKMATARIVLLSITILAMVLGSLALFGGCDYGYQFKVDPESPIITAAEFEALPESVKPQYRKLRILSKETVTKIDQGEALSQTLVTVASPFASAAPYGTAFLGLLSGMGVLWRKVKPTITAFEQTVMGIQRYRMENSEAKIDNTLNGSTSKNTKAIVRKIKDDLVLSESDS